VYKRRLAPRAGNDAAQLYAVGEKGPCQNVANSGGATIT
jgi:hypothetical protein